MSDLTELSELVQLFCEERDWDQYHNPKDLAIGISTEANELLDIFRFKTEPEMNEMMHIQSKRREISNELADVLFFVLRFAQMYNFDLKEELLCKLEDNNEKYPVEKVKGKNLKYTEYLFNEF